MLFGGVGRMGKSPSTSAAVATHNALNNDMGHERHRNVACVTIYGDLSNLMMWLKQDPRYFRKQNYYGEMVTGAIWCKWQQPKSPSRSGCLSTVSVYARAWHTKKIGVTNRTGCQQQMNFQGKQEEEEPFYLTAVSSSRDNTRAGRSLDACVCVRARAWVIMKNYVRPHKFEFSVKIGPNKWAWRRQTHGNSLDTQIWQRLQRNNEDFRPLLMALKYNRRLSFAIFFFPFHSFCFCANGINL